METGILLNNVFAQCGGCTYALKAMDTDLKVPDDIRLFKKPVAGFIGNLSSHSEIICQNLQQRAIPKVNHP